MTLPDKALLFWLLVAKSLAWLGPGAIIAWVLIRLGLRRMAVFVVNASCIGILYFLATDLAWVCFTGYHSWEYWIPLRDFIADPAQQIRRWATEEFTGESMVIFGAFVIAEAAIFTVAKWPVERLHHSFPRPRFSKTSAWLMILIICFVLGVAPALSFFTDLYVLDRILTAVPLPKDLRDAFHYVAVELASRPGGDRLDANRPTFTSAFVDRQDKVLATKFLRQAADPDPADLSSFVKKPGLPNLILIIFESFRHFAIGPESMRELDAWSRQGLRLRRHYSGSNCSHLGLFSLFYGRLPLGYYQTLDRKIPPQLLLSLRQSGYQITFLTAGEVKGHRDLDQFLNDTYCDKVVTEGEYSAKGIKDWPNSDRRKLARLRSIIDGADNRPQCVFFYLLSSLDGYAFPPDFDILTTYSRVRQFFNPWDEIQNRRNRYANSLSFLEYELMKVLRSLDLKRNIVVITGDHGESIGEDGVFRHGTRMSEIQMRVPCVIVGAGVEPRVISSATTHSDIYPTLMHLLAGRNVVGPTGQGRDLIGDLSPDDQVVLAPANGIDWDGLMLVRGDKRMVFVTQTGSTGPQAEFAGLIDEVGLYIAKVGDSSQTRHKPESMTMRDGTKGIPGQRHKR